MIKFDSGRNTWTRRFNNKHSAPTSCLVNDPREYGCIPSTRFNCNKKKRISRENKGAITLGFNGLTTHRRIGTDDGDLTGRDRSHVFIVTFKNKTYASLKPLTCSILICLTIVLLPDSPAPETGGENRQFVHSSLCVSRFPLVGSAKICARDDECVKKNIFFLSLIAKSKFQKPWYQSFDNVIDISRHMAKAARNFRV